MPPGPGTFATEAPPPTTSRPVPAAPSGSVATDPNTTNQSPPYHPSLNPFCPVCGEATTVMCAYCHRVAFCSARCDKLDMYNHTLICAQLNRLPPRPSSDYKLALLFRSSPWPTYTFNDTFNPQMYILPTVMPPPNHPVLLWVYSHLDSLNGRGIHIYALAYLLGAHFAVEKVDALAQVDPRLSGTINRVFLASQALSGIGVEPYLFHQAIDSPTPVSPALRSWVGAKALERLCPGPLLITGSETFTFDDHTLEARSADIRDFEFAEMRKLRHAFDLLRRINEGTLVFARRADKAPRGYSREGQPRPEADVQRFDACRLEDGRIAFRRDEGPRWRVGLGLGGAGPAPTASPAVLAAFLAAVTSSGRTLAPAASGLSRVTLEIARNAAFGSANAGPAHYMSDDAPSLGTAPGNAIPVDEDGATESVPSDSEPGS